MHSEIRYVRSTQRLVRVYGYGYPNRIQYERTWLAAVTLFAVAVAVMIGL